MYSSWFFQITAINLLGLRKDSKNLRLKYGTEKIPHVRGQNLRRKISSAAEEGEGYSRQYLRLNKVNNQNHTYKEDRKDVCQKLHPITQLLFLFYSVNLGERYEFLINKTSNIASNTKNVLSVIWVIFETQYSGAVGSKRKRKIAFEGGLYSFNAHTRHQWHTNFCNCRFQNV